MKQPVRVFVFFVLVLILFCSGIGLLPRLRLEKDNRSVAILVDYREIPPLAQESGRSVNEALDFLKGKGLGGLMVGDFTGEEILSGLSPVTMAPTLSRSDGKGGNSPRTLFTVPRDTPKAEYLAELLSMRSGTPPFSTPQGIGVVYPAPMESLRKSGLLPDLEGLDAGTAAAIPMFYRFAPAQTWQLQQSLELTKKILSEYPGISVAAPSGEIALGFPDLKPVASLLKERGVPVAMIEFSRQLGAPQLNWLVFPDLLSLHSVTNEELVARNIDRITLHERLVRAAVERSVRLLVLRPAASGNVGSALENFGQEVALLSEELRARGFQAAWPKPVFAERTAQGKGWGMSPFSALACALTFLLALSRYLKRMAGIQDEAMDWAEMVFFALVSLGIALLVWKAGFAARLIGALTAVFVVTEASLISLENCDRGSCKHYWRALLNGFLFAVVGGLSLAALFSEPVYMLRLKAFSGVKLTLMLPPLLVLLHDMRRRIHPESLTELLSRPPLWGELFLGMVLLVLLALILFRSDNVQFIPGFESNVRNALERFLVARPRNKEIFIGYPAFLLYIFVVNTGLWARYRELLRLGVALGFSSVVNSFCHFHTPLFFIVLREFHGLWVGVLLGILTVIVVKHLALPLWQRVRFITE